MNLRLLAVPAVIALLSIGDSAASQEQRPAPDAEHGRRLYEQACVACHTTQAHWRDRRLVRSWPDLIHQVTRWQALVGENWSRRDAEAVAAYLNEQFYHLP